MGAAPADPSLSHSSSGSPISSSSLNNARRHHRYPHSSHDQDTFRRPAESTWMSQDSNGLFDSSANANPYENFDQEAYLREDEVRRDQDAYAKTKFNQYASDHLPIDRDIPDTRNQA